MFFFFCSLCGFAANYISSYVTLIIWWAVLFLTWVVYFPQYHQSMPLIFHLFLSTLCTQHPTQWESNGCSVSESIIDYWGNNVSCQWRGPLCVHPTPLKTHFKLFLLGTKITKWILNREIVSIPLHGSFTEVLNGFPTNLVWDAYAFICGVKFMFIRTGHNLLSNSMEWVIPDTLIVAY
jgi:hypothetical protein